MDERSEVLIQPGKGERSIIENKNKKLRVSSVKKITIVTRDID
jgi:hypothetical protein